jgi:hypothetical protein
MSDRTQTLETPELGRLSLREHDIGYLVERLARVFARRPVLSAWGLQYRLCEVGPAKLDPRLLAAALRRLSGSRRGPSRPAPGLFADPVLDPEEANDRAREALEAAGTLAKTARGFGADQLARAFLASAGKGSARNRRAKISDRPSNDTHVINRRLAGRWSIQTHSVLLNLGTQPQVRIWVSDDLSWLYPDNGRLWQLLRTRAETGTPLLIIARKIAPITFHLLKAADVRGVQFYSLLSSRDPGPDVTAAADTIGLPHLLALGELRRHAVAAQIQGNLDALRTMSVAGMSSVAKKALDAAQERGFGVARGPSPAELFDWSRSTHLEWPSTWYQTLHAWTRGASLPLTIAGEHVDEIPPADDRVAATSAASQNVAQQAPDAVDATWDAPANPSEVVDDGHDAPITMISRGRVAAEVDRETWDRLLARATDKRKATSDDSTTAGPRRRKASSPREP